MKKKLKINAEAVIFSDMRNHSETPRAVDGALAFAPFWRLTSHGCYDNSYVIS